MSQAKKLVNKLTRRAKFVKEHQRGDYHKENKLESTLSKSPRAFKLSRKDQRRMDRNWGIDTIGQKPTLAKVISSTLDRHDFGVSDFGMRLTLASGLEAEIGLQPGDIITVLQGRAKEQQLMVVSLTDGTHVRLEDLASYAITAVAEKTSVTTVADSAGSLNDTYWTFSDAADAHKYYVWYNVASGGTDPLVAGRTGIEVDISSGANANTVASATRAAIAASAANTYVSSSVTGSTVSLTNLTGGAATDAANGSPSPGFTISVTQQGVNANSSPSESNIRVRCELSTVKGKFESQDV